MRVLSVASECAPLVKTGGLADVVGALPGALAPLGVETQVMLPAYRGLADRLGDAQAHAVSLGGGRTATVIAGEVDDLRVLLVDAPGLFDRPGNPYLGPDGRDWPDNAVRFGLLAETAAAVACDGLGGWRPDVVHAHDWQAGLVPAYLAGRAAPPPTLMTVHNIAFQGIFPAATLDALGLPGALFTVEGLEFHGQVGFLKGGLALAEGISTVSPGYAAEVMTPEFGMGLEGLLRHRAADLHGILNGIDTGAWDPATDPALPAPYSAAAPKAKARSRAALAERFRLSPAGDAPLFIVVSRLTEQKGMDLLLEALPVLLGTGGCLALLGSGDPALEAAFAAAAAANPGRVGAVIGYDEALSHLMQGGADAILVPSRFEPCGLTQLYALRYGTLPVVARTGGLGDTVIDANPAALAAGVATGVQHRPGSAAALADAIRRATSLHADRAVRTRMRANAMRQPVGWDVSAARYLDVYERLLTPR